jgi:hypothetical protein
MRTGSILFAVLLTASPLLAQTSATKSAREALQPFGELIGGWKGTGNLVGSLDDRQKNFWTERLEWGWQFKGNDAWIKVDLEKSKFYKTGELRPAAAKNEFTLTLQTLKNEKHAFVGTLHDKVLTLEREEGKETHKIVITMLHHNRFLYRYEVKPEGRPLFSKKWSVGATKEGESFAVGSSRPECVVSGGAGTSAVMYLGKTYYVCCSGCRDEFYASPAKYVKEYEDKLKAKKK